MAAPMNVRLDHDQVAELTLLRDNSPKPYVRERAAAILKVASGWSVRRVALHGLLRPRRPETIADWIDRYLTAGPDGLEVATGRGRKTAPTRRPPGGGDDQRIAKGPPTLAPHPPTGSSSDLGWLV